MPEDSAPLRIALIGCGSFGRQHSAALQVVPGARLVLVHDRAQARADAFAREFGASAASSASDIWSRDDVDAVIIATPTDTHFALAWAAAEAGKHILVEKPAALTLNELIQLQERCEQAAVVLLVGQSLRFEPVVLALWTSVRSGELGRPVLFNWIVNNSRPWPDGWRAWQTDPGRSGGMPLHLGIHGIDLAIWLTEDAPARVFAQGADIAAPGSRLYDYHHIALRFENGANALIEYHSSLPGRANRYQEFRLYGTLGQAHWNGNDDGLLVDASGGRSFISYADESIRREIAHFAACCRGEEAPIVTAEQLRWGLATAIAARRSLESGRAVSVVDVLEGA
jgi:predicted dehydrogenase